MNQQLALAIQRNHQATFSEFCWGNNALLKQQLHQALQGLGERFIYLWGAPGSGKSHLLQACCQEVSTLQPAIYLPLNLLKEWGPQVIEDIGEQALISVDDINAIAGDPAWEEAILHLYNRIRDQGKTILLISGHLPPAQSTIELADLRSRLTWGLALPLEELSDEDKIHTLRLHASKRGFELPISVCQFLITRSVRNMHTLHTLLEQLDEASLIAKRKITIPFVKEVFNL